MSESKKSRQWYWMPTTVFLIGMLSISLLLWVGRLSERQHNDSAIVDALMDVQIHTAEGNLWLEEALAGTGNGSAGPENVLAALDQAVYLIDVILKGGRSEHDWISEPLADLELRARAEAAKSLLLEFKNLAGARLRNHEKPRTDSVFDQQLHVAYKGILGHLRALEDVTESDKAAIREKSGRLFIGAMAIWSFIVVAATWGLWCHESRRRSAEKALLGANEQLFSQAEELKGHRERLTEMVRERTAELTAANERLRIEMAERIRACETLQKSDAQIRYLSTRLLAAHEIERRRISMELHDELGQALNVMKLRMRIMEKGLREDQRKLREECEGLLEYVDNVIEDVRRLSLDLSPTILEDLGLTSALQWLVSNLAKTPNLRIASDLAEIEQLVPQNHWITIYRVVQEALTNISRHANAENVSIVARRRGDEVVFLVEDDGKGFDAKQAAMKEASPRGLGLATMTERVRLMGGDFALWVRKGRAPGSSSVSPSKREGHDVERYRIVLADDHPLIRQGLRRLMEGVADLEIVGEASSGRELLDLLNTAAPHMAILDLSMPGLPGIEALREIKMKYPDVKVLILSMHKEYLHLALSSGANGYLLKEDTDREIFPAIENIRQGRVYICPRLTGQLLGDRAPSSEPLSTREREILKLIAGGKHNHEIADILFISIRTVENHRAHIMRKLKLKHAADLVKYAIQRGYI